MFLNNQNQIFSTYLDNYTFVLQFLILIIFPFPLNYIKDKYQIRAYFNLFFYLFLNKLIIHNKFLYFYHLLIHLI
jgi:hypothetical protein